MKQIVPHNFAKLLSKYPTRNPESFLILVDDEDAAAVTQHNWTIIFPRPNSPYAVRCTNGSTVYLHRFILNLQPGDLMVDHANSNGLDCQRKNLRLATRCQNARNQRPRVHSKTSRFKGVSWNRIRNRWHVQIAVNGHKRYIGLFADELDAAQAYDNAARALHGEFASTNFTTMLVLAKVNPGISAELQ